MLLFLKKIQNQNFRQFIFFFNVRMCNIKNKIFFLCDKNEQINKKYRGKNLKKITNSAFNILNCIHYA